MWFNPLMAGILRSPFHALLSRNTMLITVRGRRSGRQLTTPVNYVRRGDDLILVSFRSRTWWRNLRGGAPVEVRLAGKDRCGRASVVETGSGVEQGLAGLIAAAPSTARYMGVGLDGAGRPVATDVARAAEKRVVVRIHLQPSD